MNALVIMSLLAAPSVGIGGEGGSVAIALAKPDLDALMAESRNTDEVRLSNYWPPWGGTNCARFGDGECLSRTASGDPWQAWTDRGAACPKAWPFGTVVEVDGKAWECVDRGGKVVIGADGIGWVDLMTANPRYAYGTVVRARVVKPAPPDAEVAVEVIDASWRAVSP